MVIPSLVCFDVGARNGFQDLLPISEYISLYSFEPNIDLTDGLTRQDPGKYAAYHLINKGLYETAASFDLYLMNNPSMSSMLMPDWNILDEYFNKIGEFSKWRKQLEIIGQIKIDTTTIDAIVIAENLDTIDYLKIDTQGTELAILKGAQNALMDKKIVVIKTEFAFIPLYKGQPTFSEIDVYLKSMGYKLITCEFKYDAVSAFTKDSERPKYGIGGDAFYCVDFDKFIDKAKMKNAAVVLGGLGFISNASYLFKKLNVPEIEQQKFYKKVHIHNKKTVLRYFLPPFVIDLYRKLMR